MSDTVIDTLSIENVVISSGISQELDLEELQADLEECEYNPEKSPGLLYRTEDPNVTCILFRSGDIICTGASSVEDANIALNQILDVLSDLGVPITRSTSAVQNIVSSGDLQSQLNLSAISIGLGLEATEYEPEQFPGLIYRMNTPNAVVLLFGTGKCVITGTKQKDDAEQALQRVVEQLTSLELLG